MTISTTEPRIMYIGNGSTTTFPIPFDFDADANLKVELITIATGAVTLQTIITDYTISGTNVEMVTAPPATDKLLITYSLGFEQVTNYVTGDAFPAETHEDALDERVKQIKEVKHDLDYTTVRLPSNLLTSTIVTDTNIKANYVFSINSTATGIELQPGASTIDIDDLLSQTIDNADSFVFMDASNSNTPSKTTVSAFKSFLDTSPITAIIETDGSQVNDGTPTLDFDSTDFNIVESPADNFDITIQSERIQDIVGAMWTSNTETGATVTYQDADGTIDITVSDITVAGDSGSTGITPGDTLTVAGGTGITTAMSGDTLTVTNTVSVTDTFTDIEIDGVSQSTGAPTLDFDGTDFNLVESPTDSFDITIQAERIQDIVGAMFAGNTETLITVTYQDADGTIDLVVDEASINHDSLTGFVANEHIDWTSTTSKFSTSGTAATGALTVTGNIAVSGTVDGRDVATDGTKLDGIESNATADQTTEEIQDIVGPFIADGTGTHTLITITYQDATGDVDFVVDNDLANYSNANSAFFTTAGTGLTNSIVTVNLDTSTLTADTLVGATDTLPIHDGAMKKITFANFESALNHDSLTGFVANEHIDWTASSTAFSTSNTAATGALTVTGNIAVSGTVDGRDIATDGTKLDGIEANATADQTTEEIQDIVGPFIADGTGTHTGIAITYQDVTGDVDMIVSDTTFAGDTGSAAITPGSTLTIAGGTNVTTSVTGSTVTIDASGGGGAPTDATYIVQTADATLTKEQALGALTTGMLYNTTTTGVLSIATEGTDYYKPTGTDVVVSDGGTGLSSATAYAVLCGGTTSTASFQSIASVGTANQVLTSNGAGALPTFQNAAGGGGLVLLGTVSASASASMDFDNLIDSTYEVYKLEIHGLIGASDNRGVFLRIGTGATPTYQSGATDYGWVGTTRFSTANYLSYDTSDSEIQLTAGYNAGAAANEHFNCTIYIYNPADTSLYTHVRGMVVYNYYNSAYVTMGSIAGRYESTTAVTSVQVFMSSGNITSAEGALYGIVKV